jgi:hypothetical protein
MKRAATLLAIWLGALAGHAAAAANEPALPDADYCARRDANPEKCVIQNGPPHKPVVRKKKLRRKIRLFPQSRLRIRPPNPETANLRAPAGQGRCAILRPAKI